MITVRDVLQQSFGAFLDRHKNLLSRHQIKVMHALMNCRTAKLGGHKNICDDCGHETMAYNSCRDRHCPMCQSYKREQWRIDRQAELLNVHYFHVVFTVPHELNSLFINNQRQLYQLLMQSASQTVTQLAADKKYLGAQVGLTGILHTWGQTLSYHPHVHFIIPGGGLCPVTNTFKRSKADFLIPVKVLSAVFRAKFMKGLKKLLAKDALQLESTTEMQSLPERQKFLDLIYSKAFVVYAKENFASPGHVIKYLCQYTHRVAISDHRLVDIDNNTVSFVYKDYRNQNKKKRMTLDSDEFIRRLAMHILPNGFMKIRHYGFLASCQRKTKLAQVRKLLKMAVAKTSKDYTPIEFIKKFMNADFLKCPKCKSERYHILIEDNPQVVEAKAVLKVIGDSS